MPQATAAQSKVYKHRYQRVGETRYRTMEFWAEQGLIHVVDDSDGTDKGFSCRDFMARIVAVMKATCVYYRTIDERDADQKLFQDGIQAIKEALKQGDPFNAEVQEHKRKHKPQNRIVVPGFENAEKGPQVFELPRKSLLVPKDSGLGGAGHISIGG
jgi:hypothetical protein